MNLYSSIKLVLALALAVTLLPVLGPSPAPALAQDDECGEFPLSRDELLTAYQTGGSGDDMPLESMSLNFRGGVTVANAVDVTYEVIRDGTSNTLMVTFAPVLNEGRLRWDVADWSVMDADGVLMDDPPGLIGMLEGGRLKRGFNRAFLNALRASVRETYPDELPGRPSIDSLNVDEAAQNLIVVVCFAERGEMAQAGSITDDLTIDGPALMEEEGIFYYVISAGDINAAMSALVARNEPLSYLEYTLTNVLISSVIGLAGPDGEVVSLELGWVPNPDFSGSDARIVPFVGRPGTEVWYSAYVKIPDIAGESAIDPELAERAASLAMRGLNRYLSAQIDFAQVTDVTISDGALQITVVPREE